MENKIALIGSFFLGNFLNYFPLFLKSCKNNPDFDWFLFTDNKEKFDYPANVHVIYMSFDELKELVNSKFDFEVNLDKPYKLCDFKCAYGYIFEDWIKEYDFWGHTDYDMIFGNLSHFVSDKMLEKYEKLFVLGHFTLYRNTYENNRVFQKKLDGKLLFRDVFRSSESMNFDEDWNGRENINDIYRQEGISLYENPDNESMIADIYTKSSDFKVAYQRPGEWTDIIEKRTNSFFAYENGRLLRYYKNENNYTVKEYMYIHLQKRQMRLVGDVLECDSFTIIPNAFIPLKEKVSKENVERIHIKYMNLHYFRLRWKNLRTKIKKKTW